MVKTAALSLIVAGGLASACSVAPSPPSEGSSSSQSGSPTPSPMTSAAGSPTPRPTATATPVPSPTPVRSPTLLPTATAVPEAVAELTEAFLTERVNSVLVGQPLAETPFGTATVSHLTVQLADGGVAMTGEAQAGFVRLPVATTGTVHVADGRPVVRLGDVTVGGVVVPEPVRHSMEQVLQQEVDRAVARERFRARTVVVEQGKLIVRGVVGQR